MTTSAGIHECRAVASDYINISPLPLLEVSNTCSGFAQSVLGSSTRSRIRNIQIGSSSDEMIHRFDKCMGCSIDRSCYTSFVFCVNIATINIATRSCPLRKDAEINAVCVHIMHQQLKAG